jgi:hypothetical protein
MAVPSAADSRRTRNCSTSTHNFAANLFLGGIIYVRPEESNQESWPWPCQDHSRRPATTAVFDGKLRSGMHHRLSGWLLRFVPEQQLQRHHRPTTSPVTGNATINRSLKSCAIFIWRMIYVRPEESNQESRPWPCQDHSRRPAATAVFDGKLRSGMHHCLSEWLLWLVPNQQFQRRGRVGTGDVVSA